MEIGTICMKIAGREAGLYCVIVDKVDDNFVVITGPKTITRVKKRKCNINHLEPTSEKFDIKAEEDDSKIEKLWKKSDLIEKFNIKVSKPRVKKEKPAEKVKK